MNDLQPPIHDYDAYLASYSPPPPAKRSTFEIVVMSLCGVLAAHTLPVALFCAFVVISSYLSTDLSTDPHGYGTLFGTVVGVPAFLLTAVVLPGAFPRGMRGLAFAVSVLVFGGAAVSLCVLLVNSS